MRSPQTSIRRLGQRTWSQWSCTVAVCVEDARHADEAARLTAALMDDVDLAVSRFRDDSELAACNRRAGRATLLSPLAVTLIDAALAAARQSYGRVDPTIGRHLEAAGYDRDIADLTGAVGTRTQPERLPSWRDVRLDHDLAMVVVPRGLALDLGATAKAWTADLAAQLIADAFPGRVLVEIGGDVAVSGAGQDAFMVRVAERAGQPGELVSMYDGGLATSTTEVRRWGRGSSTAHHIIDPRTGLPSRGPWRTASVWSTSTVEANTASTGAIVAGADALEMLEDERRPARLVAQDGTIVHTSTWPNSSHFDAAAS